MASRINACRAAENYNALCSIKDNISVLETLWCKDTIDAAETVRDALAAQFVALAAALERSTVNGIDYFYFADECNVTSAFIPFLDCGGSAVSGLSVTDLVANDASGITEEDIQNTERITNLFDLKSSVDRALLTLRSLRRDIC